MHIHIHTYTCKITHIQMCCVHVCVYVCGSVYVYSMMVLWRVFKIILIIKRLLLKRHGVAMHTGLHMNGVSTLHTNVYAHVCRIHITHSTQHIRIVDRMVVVLPCNLCKMFW